MQGASRSSLASVQEQLDALARSGDQDRLDRAAEGIFAVGAVLEREGALRRAFADPVLAGETKSQLVRSLFGGQIDESALAVLESVLSARWSRSSDLLDALDIVGASAVLIVAQAAGELDEVEDELFRFSRIVDREPALLMALTDRALPVERKRELVRSLLAGRARPATVQLVDEAISHPRGRTLDRALADYADLAASRRQRLVAEVRVAVPLTDEQEARLRSGLAREFGAALQLQVEIDPQVLGGVRVQVRDSVLDGTVAHRLVQARQRLVR